LLVAGVTIVMGIITAEALYTAPYDARMEISDLGASETGVILQPSATIFNATMVVAGALIIAGTWFAHRALHRDAGHMPLTWTTGATRNCMACKGSRGPRPDGTGKPDPRHPMGEAASAEQVAKPRDG
jgi:hypothetical protein